MVKRQLFHLVVPALLGLPSGLLSADRDFRSVQVTTDRLAYRLVQRDSLYELRMHVQLVNTGRDTVFFASRCNFGSTPQRDLLSMDGASYFLPFAQEVCLAGATAAPARYALAIPPDAAWKDSLVVLFKPFIPRGRTEAPQGIARFRLSYRPFVRRGFFRKAWVTDQRRLVLSDPFELITPGHP